MAIRVLVVDDEKSTLNLLRTILEIGGYEAITTWDAREAVPLAVREQPDVALLDVMMPDIDGFTLCTHLRGNPQTQQIPVIFVTAYSALDLEEKRRAAGGDMVLPKPVNMDTLIDAIAQLTSE